MPGKALFLFSMIALAAVLVGLVVLIAKPDVAELQIHVGMENVLVEIQNAGTGRLLSKGVADRNGVCKLRISNPSAKNVLVIARPEVDSGFLASALILDYRKLLDDGSLTIALRRER